MIIKKDPFEDCISRQDVKELFDEGDMIETYHYLGIDFLPCVKPKTGKWKMIGNIGLAFKCSICEEITTKMSNYCSYCGAKMESEV